MICEYSFGCIWYSRYKCFSDKFKEDCFRRYDLAVDEVFDEVDNIYERSCRLVEVGEKWIGLEKHSGKRSI